MTGVIDRPVIVSGVQSNGALHLGNLLGAIQNWARKQDDFLCYVFIADLHALTVPERVKAEQLREGRLAAAGMYIASGISPERSVVFCQSDVYEHAYAGWLLTCLSPLGWLERMTQFKGKAVGKTGSVGAGLLTYPALQAADILLYDATFVPTGEDQKQHLEFTRDLAERFNAMYGDTFTIPQPLIETVGAKIMGLDDPTVKMSKSLSDKAGHAIMLLDDPEEIRRKLRRAQTDSSTNVEPATAGPGVRNLLQIFAATSGCTYESAGAEFHGVTYGKLKDAVADVVIERLKHIQGEYRRVMLDQVYLRDVLQQGAERAHQHSSKTLARMRLAVGLV